MINSLPKSIFSGENQINLVSNLSYLPFIGKYDPFLTVLVGYAQAVVMLPLPLSIPLALTQRVLFQSWPGTPLFSWTIHDFSNTGKYPVFPKERP